MNTFDTIIYKTINIKNNIFSYNYDTTDTVSGIHKILFNCWICNKIMYKNKHLFLHNTINNFYLSENEKERNEFINYFYKIQKTYHTLNRLCFLFKIRKAKLVVNTDLQLNDINIKQKNVLSIYHNNNNYLFTIQDILKIIYTSLTNTFMFFSEPITIKNPYNNLPFEKSILYFIYFYLIQNTFIGYIKSDHIDIFLKFKECNFDMTKFVDSYEYILREYSFKIYINNSTKQQLKYDIFKMIREYNEKYPKFKIYIDIDFPLDKLLKSMKPYLNLYLIACYSLVHKNRVKSISMLFKKMRDFQKYNPAYGRKIIIMKDKIKNGRLVKYKSHTDFNCNYKKFTNQNNANFMNNHLSYKYDGENNIEYQDNDNESTIENHLDIREDAVIQNNLLDTNRVEQQNNDEDSDEGYNTDIDEDIIESESDYEEYNENDSIS